MNIDTAQQETPLYVALLRTHQSLSWAWEKFGELLPPPVIEHDYIPMPGTELDSFGPVICKRCWLPAEGSLSWPCTEQGPSDAAVALNSIRSALAVTLHDFVYGPGAWVQDGDQRGNYYLDALEILQSHPHLGPLLVQELIENATIGEL